LDLRTNNLIFLVYISLRLNKEGGYLKIKLATNHAVTLFASTKIVCELTMAQELLFCKIISKVLPQWKNFRHEKESHKVQVNYCTPILTGRALNMKYCFEAKNKNICIYIRVNTKIIAIA
jgi:hypothetical protein